MAKVQVLKDIESGEIIYPETSAEAVFLNTGGNIKDEVDKLNASIKKKQDALTTSDELEIGAGNVLRLTKKTADVLAEVPGLGERLGVVETELGLAIDAATGRYCVGAWDPDSLAPEVAEVRGDRSLLADQPWWLIDTTAPMDEETKGIAPMLELNPGNLLRTVNGGFAPTVGITEAQRAECDVALYLDAAGEQQYCEAGSFDAVAFYEEHGMAKLYDEAGNEVRVLRPWETVETKYTIGTSFRQKVYLLDNIIGRSGKMWAGIFTKPIVWDGIELTEEDALPPTALLPCAVTTIGNRARAFFYAYEGETYCKSGKGVSNLCTMFNCGRTYPRTGNVSALSYDISRGNNADPTKPYPCAEGGFHSYNALLVAREVLIGTKALHKPGMFGSGPSANDGCSNETQWLANGGVRYRVAGSNTWLYAGWNSAPSGMAYDASGARTDLHNMLSGYWPVCQCMEAQMVLSFARERSIGAGEHFDFYGGEYWYENVEGTDASRLNARVYKLMRTSFGAFDTTGAPTDWEVEVILRMSPIDGLTFNEGILIYRNGGMEIVGLADHNQEADRYHFPCKVYREPNQKKWHAVKNSSVVPGGEFSFEGTYSLIGDYATFGDVHCRKRMSKTPIALTSGGSDYTGQCYHDAQAACWADTTGSMKRVRIGLAFSGRVPHTVCGPRLSNRFYSISNSFYYYGVSAQFLLSQTRATNIK